MLQSVYSPIFQQENQPLTFKFNQTQILRNEQNEVSVAETLH